MFFIDPVFYRPSLILLFLPGMKFRKSSNSGRIEKNEDIVAKAHVALWPQNDMETFERILKEHPEVIDSKFGRCKDTLLIRYDRIGNGTR